MKRLLLPLLAAIALPSPVNAETWWLMAAGRNYEANSTWSIPTNSEQECEFAGQKFLNSSFPTLLEKGRGYVCVKGK